MDLELTDDQVALRDELRRFLANRCDGDVRRAAMALPGAVDRDLWAGLAGMGVFTLTRPEADGGVGLGLTEAAITYEELGRAAVPGPVIPTFLAATIPGVPVDVDVVGLVERPGRARDQPAIVEHLHALDALLVLGAAGVSMQQPLPPERWGGRLLERPLDPLTPVTLVPTVPDGAPVDGGGDELAHRLRRDGAVLAAAMQVGLGAAAIDLAVDYAGNRTQFGRPIGSFQALKHLLADAAVAVEVARAAVHAAAVTIDEHDADEGDADHIDRAVAAARVVASDAAKLATETSIQVHGGIGFTWELDAHLYLKRSLVLDQSYLTPEAALDLLADRLAASTR